MRYPLQLITYSINPAIQPILSGEKRDLIISEHNKLIEKLLVMSVPIALFMGINSEKIVLLLFGEQWNKVGVLVSILSFIIPIQMVLSTSGAFFQSLKKPQLLFYSGAIAALINITFIITGVYLGSIISVAICLCISYSLSFIVIYHVLFKYAFCISCGDFYRIIAKTICRYAPVIILYSAIVTLFFVSTDMVFFDLLISGILLLLLLAIFNLNMLKKTLLTSK